MTNIRVKRQDQVNSLREKVPGLKDFRLLEGLGVHSAILLKEHQLFYSRNKDQLLADHPGLVPPDHHSVIEILYEMFRRCQRYTSRRGLDEETDTVNSFIGSQFRHIASHMRSPMGKYFVGNCEVFSKEVVRETYALMASYDDVEAAWTDCLAEVFKLEPDLTKRFPGKEYTLIPVKEKRGVIVEFDSTHSEFLSVEQAKMVRIKIREMTTLLALAKGMSGQAFREEFFSDLCELITEMYRFSRRCNTEGRSTAAFPLIESLLNGELLLQSDTDFINDGFLLNIYATLREDVKGLPDDYYLTRFHEIASRLTPPELVEAMSISKSLGYAEVNAEKTFEKVSERLSARVVVNPVVLQDFEAFIRHNFCQNYYLSNRKWPHVQLGYGVHRGLTQAVMQNVWISDPRIVSRFGRATYQAFSEVTFEKTISWDPYVEAIELAKDTSRCPTRHRMIEHSLALEGLYAAYEISASAVQDALVKVQETKLRIDEKSLLASMLATRNLNDRLITSNENYYSRSVSMIANLACQKLVPKATELKTEKGRLFGMLTMELRHKRSVDQHNADKVHRIWQPLNVKSASDSQIIEAMNRISYYHSMFDKREDRINFTIMIDAERWCNCHTVEVYDNCVGKVFDEVLGSRSFRNIMKEFKIESKILSSDGTVRIYKRVPNAVSNYDEPGPGEGIEGQQQTIWGDGYGSVILYSLRDIEDVVVANNGDNAEAFCSADRGNIRPGESDLEYMNRVVAELSVRMLNFGYRIKLTETLVSKNMSIMCKRVIERGRLLGSGLKKGSKMCNEPEDAFMTSENIISSMSSNLCSAVYQGMSHVTFYTVYVSRLVLYIKSLLRSHNKLHLSRVLFRPASLGGYPIARFVDVIVRGCSDVLSRDLSLLRYCSSYDNDTLASGVSEWILTHTPIVERGEPFVIVVRNPMALSVDRPRSATQVITAEMLKVISRSRNQRLSKLAKIKLREIRFNEYDYLTRLALSLRPFSPRVANAIASCGDDSLLASVLSKFTKSRTLTSTFILNGYKIHKILRLLDQVTVADLRYINYLLETPEHDIRDPTLTTVRHSQNLRERCFGPMTYDSYPPEVEAFIWIDDEGQVGDYPFSPEFTVLRKDRVDLREREGHNEPLNRKVDLERKTKGKLDVKIPEFCVGNKKFDRIRKLLTIIGHLGQPNQRLRAHLMDYIREQDYEIAAELGPLIPTKYSGTLRHRMSIMSDDMLSGLNAIAGFSTNMKKELRKAVALATLGDTSTNMILLECFATMMICTQLMVPSANLPGKQVYRFTISRDPENLHDVSDPVFTFIKERPEKSFVFTDEHPIEKLFTMDSIAEATADKKFRALLSFTSPRVVTAARTILAMSYARPKKELSEELARFKGHRGLSREDFELIEGTFGIKTTNLTFSLNDLRSLPVNFILLEIVSCTISWAIFHEKLSLRNLEYASVQMVQVYDLPMGNLARELIDSMYMPVIALAVTGHGLPAPSTGECISVESCQRYLLKTSTRIISGYLKGDKFKTLMPNERDALVYSPDDIIIHAKIVERMNVRAMRAGNYILKEYHHLDGNNCLKFLQCMMYLEVETAFRTDRESSVVNLLRVRRTKVTQLKMIDSPVKTLISSVLRFPWWQKAWGEATKVTGPLDQTIMTSIIRSMKVTISVIRVEDAITVARANPGVEFRAFIHALTSFQAQPVAGMSASIPIGHLPINRAVHPHELDTMKRSKTAKMIAADLHAPANIKPSNFNRLLGREVTSCNKFLDLLERFKMLKPPRPDSPFATFCEGSGGCALMLLELFKGNCLFNTLIQGNDSLFPQCIFTAGNSYISRTTLLASATQPSDMTKIDTVHLYVQLAALSGLNSFFLVTCDAESQRDVEIVRQSLSLFNNVSYFIAVAGHALCVLIFKVSTRDEALLGILARSHIYFRMSTLVRSTATHTDSAEYYLICAEPCRQAILSWFSDPSDVFLHKCPSDVYTRSRNTVSGLIRGRAGVDTYPGTVSFKYGTYSFLLPTLGYSVEKFLRGQLFLDLTYQETQLLFRSKRFRQKCMVDSLMGIEIASSRAVVGKARVDVLIRRALHELTDHVFTGDWGIPELQRLNLPAYTTGLITRIVASGMLPRSFFPRGSSLVTVYGAEFNLSHSIARRVNNLYRIAGHISMEATGPNVIDN